MISELNTAQTLIANNQALHLVNQTFETGEINGWIYRFVDNGDHVLAFRTKAENADKNAWTHGIRKQICDSKQGFVPGIAAVWYRHFASVEEALLFVQGSQVNTEA